MEFPLHTYLNKLRTDGAPPDYIDALYRNAQPLAERGLPVILTLGHLAHVTNVSYRLLLGIVRRNSDPYRVFSIKKRNGNKRFICVPEPLLLYVQRWIHSHILTNKCSLCLLSNNATAYMPNSSHVKNAKRHVGANWLVKLDITSFFESVSERQVYHVFRKLGYRAQVAFCFARLCTRVLPYDQDMRFFRGTKRWKTGRKRICLSTKVIGHLPQGAPTSPMLANLVCASIDTELQEIAQRNGLMYTRYADDMTFSGYFENRSAAVALCKEVSLVISKNGFSINSQKTNIAKNGGRKIVTGLSVDGPTVRLPRSYKDKIRQELYYIEKHGLPDHCARTRQKNQLSYLLHLDGKIKYIKSIEPAFGEKIEGDFRKLFPDFAAIEMLS
ncbi:MAG: reverse transcriptase family protein [Geobacteraceae bacterium]|nr:reverse transcriptase family protein [Geobacteraceae bacterium]